MKSSQMSDLGTKGFVTLSYPKDLRAAVTKTIASWQSFTALPVEQKKALPYSNGSAGVGYEFKEGKGNKADRKENFDLTSGGEQWLKENLGAIDSAVAVGFVKDAVSLIGLVKPLIQDFAKKAEKEFGLKGFTEEVAASEDTMFIRFIHYFGDRQSGEETASAHTDQSGFTLHLFESDAGLQCLTYGGEWIDMPVSDGETVIIPDMQMQLRSEGRLRALCHRVVANEKTAAAGRYSAVCFIQLKNTPKYDKENNGRLQEKMPGFNYDMSHDEFKKLFK